MFDLLIFHFELKIWLLKVVSMESNVKSINRNSRMCTVYDMIIAECNNGCESQKNQVCLTFTNDSVMYSYTLYS